MFILLQLPPFSLHLQLPILHLLHPYLLRHIKLASFLFHLLLPHPSSTPPSPLSLPSLFLQSPPPPHSRHLIRISQVAAISSLLTTSSRPALLTSPFHSLRPTSLPPPAVHHCLLPLLPASPPCRPLLPLAERLAAVPRVQPSSCLPNPPPPSPPPPPPPLPPLRLQVLPRMRASLLPHALSAIRTLLTSPLLTPPTLHSLPNLSPSLLPAFYPTPPSLPLQSSILAPPSPSFFYYTSPLGGCTPVCFALQRGQVILASQRRRASYVHRGGEGG